MIDWKGVAFFDAREVLREIDRTKKRAHARFGAFVRRTAQQSMRKRKGPSPVGKPPSVHQGQLKKLLFFVWDERTQSVVTGPIPFAAGDAPERQEYGGAARLKMPNGKTVQARFPARPFMTPAFDQELANLPAHWEAAQR